MKNKLLLLFLSISLLHLPAAAAHLENKNTMMLYAPSIEGMAEAVGAAIAENPDLIWDYHTKDRDFIALMDYFSAQAAHADDIHGHDLAVMEGSNGRYTLSHFFQNRTLSDGGLPSKSYLASFFPPGTHQDLYAHNEGVARDLSRVAALLKISILQHRIMLARNRPLEGTKYLRDCQLLPTQNRKDLALNALHAKLASMRMESEDIPNTQAVISRVIAMHPSPFNAMMLYLELVMQFGKMEFQLNHSTGFEFDNPALKNSTIHLQNIYYIQREILNRLWPWAEEAIASITEKFLPERKNPNFDLSAYVDMSGLSDSHDEEPVKQSKHKKKKKKKKQVPLKATYELQPMSAQAEAVIAGEVDTKGMSDDEGLRDAAAPQHLPEAMTVDESEAKGLSDDEGDNVGQTDPAQVADAPAQVAAVSRFPYVIPELGRLDSVFENLNKKRKNVLDHLFPKNEPKKGGAEVTNHQIELLANHLVESLGLARSDYARKFLRDLRSKFHEPHSADTGNKLPKNYFSYLRATFIRWGMFPSDFMGGNTYKIDGMALDAMDTYAIRAGVSLDN